MPPSRHQRWPHRQLPETLCQRRRPKSMRTSTPSSRQWTRGTRMARRRKVRVFYLISSAQTPQAVRFFADNFYSSSDSESEDEIERKIHVEIKPLNNGTAPISASVDELRATVENLSLSPIGALSVISQLQCCCFIFFHERALFSILIFRLTLELWSRVSRLSTAKHISNLIHVETCFLIYCISMPRFFFLSCFLHLSASNTNKKIAKFCFRN